MKYVGMGLIVACCEILGVIGRELEVLSVGMKRVTMIGEIGKIFRDVSGGGSVAAAWSSSYTGGLSIDSRFA
jgi:hypothetical protein